MCEMRKNWAWKPLTLCSNITRHAWYWLSVEFASWASVVGWSTADDTLGRVRKGVWVDMLGNVVVKRTGVLIGEDDCADD